MRLPAVGQIDKYDPKTYQKTIAFFLALSQSGSSSKSEDAFSKQLFARELQWYASQLSDYLSENKGLQLKSILEFSFMNEQLLLDIFTDMTIEKKQKKADEDFKKMLDQQAAIISDIEISNPSLLVLGQSHPASHNETKYIIKLLNGLLDEFDPNGQVEIQYQTIGYDLMQCNIPDCYYVKICGDVAALDLLKLLEICRPFITDELFLKKKNEFMKIKSTKEMEKENSAGDTEEESAGDTEEELDNSQEKVNSAPEPKTTQTYNSGLYAKYPNANTDPSDYLRSLLDSFIRSHATHMEQQFILEYKLIVHESDSKDLYNKMHQLLTKFDYKNKFSAEIREKLCQRIIFFIEKYNEKEISAVRFSEEIEGALRNCLDSDTLFTIEDNIAFRAALKIQKIILTSKDLPKDFLAFCEILSSPPPEGHQESTEEPYPEVVLRVLQAGQKLLIEFGEIKKAYEKFAETKNAEKSQENTSSLKQSADK